MTDLRTELNNFGVANPAFFDHWAERLTSDLGTTIRPQQIRTWLEKPTRARILIGQRRVRIRRPMFELGIQLLKGAKTSEKTAATRFLRLALEGIRGQRQCPPIVLKLMDQTTVTIRHSDQFLLGGDRIVVGMGCGADGLPDSFKIVVLDQVVAADFAV